MRASRRLLSYFAPTRHLLCAPAAVVVPAAPAATQSLEYATSGRNALRRVPIDAIANLDAERVVWLTRRTLQGDHAFARAQEMRLRGRRWRRSDQAPSFHFATLRRSALFSAFAAVVERRAVPLQAVVDVIGAVPDATFGPTYTAFVRRSVVSWIAESVQRQQAQERGASTPAEDDNKTTTTTITPLDAVRYLRVVAMFAPHQTSLVGSLASIFLRELDTIPHANVIISAMWAVHEAGTHAPDAFWSATVRRLAHLNRTAPATKTAAAAVDAQEEEEEVDGVPSRGGRGGSLTLRQVFRALRVLRRERWCKDIRAIRALAWGALRRMDEVVASAMEKDTAAALVTTPEAATSVMTLPRVTRRIGKLFGLAPSEFLSFLTLAAELGLSFSRAGEHLCSDVIAPLARVLPSRAYPLLLDAASKSRCENAAVVQGLVDRLAVMGRSSPDALVHIQDLFRFITLRDALSYQLRLSHLFDLAFHLAEPVDGLRGQQMLNLTLSLYILTRRFTKTSEVGVKMRTMVERFAGQLSRMLENGVLRLGLCERFLETTVVLGMRSEPARYPHVASLHRLRVAAHKAMQQNDGDDEKERLALIPSEYLSVVPGHSIAVARVYRELYGLHQRMAVFRYKPFAVFVDNLRRVLAQCGNVVDILRAADTVRTLHLAPKRTSSSAASSAVETPLHPFVQRVVTEAVLRKLRTQASSDRATTMSPGTVAPATAVAPVFRSIGHEVVVHVDPEELRALVARTPLRLLKQKPLFQHFVRQALAGSKSSR